MRVGGLLCYGLAAAGLAAQPPADALTIGNAVRLALERYPAGRAARERAAAAAAGVDLAKTACWRRPSVEPKGGCARS